MYLLLLYLLGYVVTVTLVVRHAWSVVEALGLVIVLVFLWWLYLYIYLDLCFVETRR